MAINTRNSRSSSGTKKIYKAERHSKKLKNDENNTNILNDLITKCLTKLKINFVNLSMLCGTINIKRCSDIVNDIYLDSSWYKKRKNIYDIKRNTCQKH